MIPRETGSDRLIDAGTFHYEASLAGLSERYFKGKTSHTALVWWARRPHSAMRALVFASLCRQRDPTNGCTSLLHELGATPSPSPELQREAKRLLHQQYGKAPTLLDMFAGGGTIPQEAAQLGCEAHAIDSNELAVFINRVLLEYAPQMSAQEAEAEVLATGQRVLERLQETTAWAYPLRAPQGDGAPSPTASDVPSAVEARQPPATAGRVSTPLPFSRQPGDLAPVTTYLWSYALPCEACGYQISLQKRPWLSTKKQNRQALMLQMTPSGDVFTIGHPDADWQATKRWPRKGRSATCPSCGHVHEEVDFKRCQDVLLVAVTSRWGKGKHYYPAPIDATPSRDALQDAEDALLQRLNATLPDSTLPRWSGIANPALYGMEHHADLFNPRQRYVCLALIELLRDEHENITRRLGQEKAAFVLGCLSGLLDQLIDWNCRLSMWIPQNEQVGRAFCGPGISMLWDYAESDPGTKGPANLFGKLKRIAQGAAEIAALETPGFPQKGYAQALPYPDESFDAIVTDPPYYDNIFYTVLADCFFAWKRILLDAIAPDLFDHPRTDDSQELVASVQRHGTDAHEQYCHSLIQAFCEAARVLKEPGRFSLVYSHATLQGWEALVRGLSGAPLHVMSAQPLSIERRQRPRGVFSNAIDTCVVFVSQKSSAPKPEITLAAYQEQLQRQLAHYEYPTLLDAGWSEKDVGMALFAQGCALLGNVASLTDASWRDALQLAESMVQELCNSFKLRRRRSM